MFLLRDTERTITDICFDVGFGSLGTFSRTFREIVGETPTEYRAGHEPMAVPHCFQMASTRPAVGADAAWLAAANRARAPEPAQESSFGEAATTPVS